MMKTLLLGVGILMVAACQEELAGPTTGASGETASGGVSGAGGLGESGGTTSIGGATGTGGITSTSGADAGTDARPDALIRWDGVGTDNARLPDADPGETGASSCNPASLISTTYLSTKLAELSGASSVTINGQAQTIKERFTVASRQLARAFLRQEYEALGFIVTEHTYATGTNLIAQKKGIEDKIVMLSAHYDSASASVPGADDDGTGVVGGLAVARALADCILDRELRIVAFDEEELGTKGSAAYVTKLVSSGESTKLNGNIVMEMYGYDKNNDGGFIVLDCSTISGNSVLIDALKGAIVEGKLSLVMKNAPNCKTGADHAPFWAKKLPAIVFSEEFFIANADTTPCYHKSCDRVDQINFDYMTKLTTMATLAAAKLTGAH